MKPKATKTAGRKLFLETSAQILRLAGSPEIQQGIEELIASSTCVGTSQFVRQEFEHTYVKLYKYIAAAADGLADPHRHRAFGELWQEIHSALPAYIPGGQNLLFSLTMKLTTKHGNSLMTPVFLKNFFEGSREALVKGFLVGEFFDSSSCCVWKQRGLCSCSPAPEASCKLKDICVDLKESFHSSARTLALRHREESKWLYSNLERILRSSGIQLISLVGAHPNHFGDLIIFWEVPDQWTILTRDRTFKILQTAHRRHVSVFIVRGYRKPSATRCSVEPVSPSRQRSSTAKLVNYNSKGVRVSTKRLVARKGDRINLVAREFQSPRHGVVIYRDHEEYGIKLVMRDGRGQQ